MRSNSSPFSKCLWLELPFVHRVVPKETLTTNLHADTCSEIPDDTFPCFDLQVRQHRQPEQLCGQHVAGLLSQSNLHRSQRRHRLSCERTRQHTVLPRQWELHPSCPAPGVTACEQTCLALRETNFPDQISKNNSRAWMLNT